MPRKALSKKTRFEVFKRDLFTCQYCGAHPPAVVLEVDHVHPVAKGGGNDADNLVTSCFDCNRGKSDRSLQDVPQSLQDKAKLILEREAQIKGYQAVMDAKKSRVEDDAERVREVYELFQDGYTLTEKSMVTVRFFVERLGVHDVCEAMEIAHTSARSRVKDEFKYFCGICWRKIREIAQ